MRGDQSLSYNDGKAKDLEPIGAKMELYKNLSLPRFASNRRGFELP
jgi:hypothetical protein